MAEGRWSFERRVVIEDVRRDDTYLRVTWHAESRVYVVSHWKGSVCVAATRVPVEASPDLVRLFVDGLAESATPPAAQPADPGASFGERLLGVVRRWRGRSDPRPVASVTRPEQQSQRSA